MMIDKGKVCLNPLNGIELVVSEIPPEPRNNLIWMDVNYPEKHIYLPMDESEGSTLYDLSGNELHASSVNTTIVDGIRGGGKARRGNGVDAYIDLPAGWDPSALTGFRVSFDCVRHADKAGWASLYSHYVGASTGGLYISANTDFGGISARMKTTVSDSLNMNPGYMPAIGEKTHVDFIYTGLYARLIVSLIQPDGSLRERASMCSGILSGVVSPALRPGRLLASNAAVPAEFADWSMDNFKITVL